MTPFRLTRWEAKESDLQGQIVDYLRAEQARKRVVWFCRVNGGMASRGKRKIPNYYLWLFGAEPLQKGYADLHGMLAGGRYFALEVKRPDEKATAEQRAFLDAVRFGGGVGAVVRSWQDARSLLFDEREVE
jgi:hypothetical protein